LVDERRCVEVENGVSEMITRNKTEEHINVLFLVLEFLSQNTNDRMTDSEPKSDSKNAKIK
jgi:hypothetical protein